MSKVDWSKAPEGAEFYAFGRFRKRIDGGELHLSYSEKGWVNNSYTLLHCRQASDFEYNPMDPQFGPVRPVTWPDENRIDVIAQNGNDGEHYAPTHPVTAVEFLNACVAVQSERGQQYDPNGNGERSFAAAAVAFTALTGKPLVGSDICLIIELVKKVRQYSKPDRIHHDSLLDSVSYDSLWAAELIKELSK